MIVCFDTQIVIWGVQQKADASQKNMVARTARYIQSLREERSIIMIPTPVLQEYLLGLPPEKVKEELSQFESHFFIPALDAPAAVLAAQLESDKDLIQDIRKGEEKNRHKLRVDAQIVAIAIIHGAERIISSDSHVKKLAGDRIEVRDVPDVYEQAELELQTEGDEPSS